MVVVAARRQEEDVAGRAPAGHVAGLEDDVEAEDVDVEGANPIDVGRAQVDVPDPQVRIDRALGGARRDHAALRARGHAPTSIRSRIDHGSATSKPASTSLVGTPARSRRVRTSVTSSACGSRTVQWRSPTVWAGTAPTPRPRHTFNPRWWW